MKGKVRGRYAKHVSNDNEKSKAQPSQKPKKRTLTFGSDSEISSDEDADVPSYRDSEDEEGMTNTTGHEDGSSGESKPTVSTFLDGDFLELTGGKPLPLTDRAKAAFHFSILNVRIYFALFLYFILDYQYSFTFPFFVFRRIHYFCPLSMFWTIQFLLGLTKKRTN